MIVTQPDRVLLRQQVAKFAPHLSGKLLDVGGGDGRRYKGIAPEVTSCVTLDMNPDLKPDLVASAEAIPLEDNSIDSVLCTQLLEHVPHPWIVFKEIHRVLRPGGKALLTVPQLNELHEEPHDYFRYTIFGLRSMAADTGFRVLEVDQRGRYRCCMAQMRIRRWIDALRPYQNRWAMLLMALPTLLYTNWAIWRDERDSSPAVAKHTIGWALVLEKPAN